jgi:hypothetical protein
VRCAAFPEKFYWSTFVAWHAYQAARIPHQTLEKTLAIQNRRVRSMVRHAYQNVIHYREVMDRLRLRPEDFRTAQDLERLPVVTKDELLDSPERFIDSAYANGQGLLLRSSGTSGRARTIIYDPRALFLALGHGYRQRQAVAQLVGRSVGLREIDFSRAGSLGSQIRAFYESHSWMPPGIELRRLFLDPADPFERILERWNHFRPVVPMWCAAMDHCWEPFAVGSTTGAHPLPAPG